MALDVASTTLSTPAWAEFSTVSYNAGTLSNQAACVTEVESKLQRGTLSSTTTPTDTEVKRWLQRAKQELAEVRQFTWKRRYVTGTLTAGTYRYSVPADFAGGRISIRDITNDVRIGMVSPHQFDVLYPDPDEESNGSILVACVKGMELWVCPPPDGDDVIEMEYERSGDDVDPTDFSWLPEIERFRCCDFAIAESFASLHQWESANFYRALWVDNLKKSTRSDGKRRYSTMGYRARSVFQA